MVPTDILSTIEIWKNIKMHPCLPKHQDLTLWVFLRMLWQKLLDVYIAPNGPREVNLPSEICDQLLSAPCTSLSPDPALLEPAVEIMFELMEESMLVPFLYSVAPSGGPGTAASPRTSYE
jgi:hypothetical protein